MLIETHFLPLLVRPEHLAESTVVVIDILRATTTLTQALVSGAGPIIPCLNVEDARRVAESQPAGCRLGGERGGRRIDGFDFGNSPFEYTSESVAGRALAFTTTNGTRALRHASAARQLLLGTFRSLSALVARLKSAPRVSLLCAGTDGEVTQEDVLFAGAVVERLTSKSLDSVFNDESLLARAAWRDVTNGSGDSLLAALRASRGGRNLIELGMDRDIEFAAQIDQTEVVGEWELTSGRIVRS